MTYDFRASEYKYYVLNNKPNRVLYGPFEGKTEAEVALLLSVPMDDFKRLMEQRQYHGFQVHQLREAGLVDLYVGTLYEADIRSLLEDPQSNGFKKVTIKPKNSLKRHPSWKAGWAGFPAEKAAFYYVTGDKSHMRP